MRSTVCPMQIRQSTARGPKKRTQNRTNPFLRFLSHDDDGGARALRSVPLALCHWGFDPWFWGGHEALRAEPSGSKLKNENRRIWDDNISMDYWEKVVSPGLCANSLECLACVCLASSYAYDCSCTDSHGNIAFCWLHNQCCDTYPPTCCVTSRFSCYYNPYQCEFVCHSQLNQSSWFPITAVSQFLRAQKGKKTWFWNRAHFVLCNVVFCVERHSCSYRMWKAVG